MNNQAPFFNAQFLDDDGTPLAYGLLYTYASGTTTPQVTYQDQAGGATNTNPIVLDAAGRCDLWLDPDLEYTLKLERADETLVKTWDDVVGAAGAADVVTSVNALTGAVSLTADDIPFTTGTSTTWFSGTDVSEALDAIINRADGVVTASTVTIADAGALITATTVEGALQELAMPAGAVQAFALSSAPTGWLECNGSNVNRTTYARLFAAIGTTFGVGDGSATFGLPDLRGEFLRGWDNGRGVDSGRAFGSAQADMVEAHKHVMAVGEHLQAPFGATTTQENGIGASDTNNELPYTNDGSDYDGLATNTAGVIGAETRPRNVALLYCIRY